MFNTRVSVHGLMGFKDVDIDLGSINGKVIAISGDNGEGKTTLLESIGFAGLYRKLPSREQGIHKYCKGEAFIENEFVFDGKSYKTKILINSSGNRSEAYLFENGKVVNDGKTGTFDEAIVKRFGTSELVLSSVFSAQDRIGGFIKLPKPKRKDLFISMLNLGMLQKISSYADQCEAQAKEKESSIAIKIQSLEQACNTIIPDRDVLMNQKDFHAKEIAKLEDKISEIRILKSKEDVKIEEQKEKQSQRKVIQDIIKELELRKRKFMGDISALNLDLSKQSFATPNRMKELEILHNSLPDLEISLKKQREELDSINKREQERMYKISESKEKVRHLRDGLRRTKNELEKCKSGVQKLKIVPCGGDGIYSTCPLIADAIKQRTDISYLEEEELIASQQIESIEIWLDQFDTDRIDTSSHIRDINNTEAQIMSSRMAGELLTEALSYQMQAANIKDKIADSMNNVDFINRQIGTQQSSLNEISKQITVTSSDSPSFRLMKELSIVENALKGEKAELHGCIMELGKIDIMKKNRDSALKVTKQLNQEMAEIRINKDQWSHLSYAFGPKAIQSLEIDSAGPWVSDLINSLLQSCFGSRFSISLITQAAKADKSGMKDFFDIEVTDADKNRTGLLNDLSGGEKVICAEAISLAISLYNSNIGGTKWDTLYRDECSGALSPKNALLYIKMLRKAIELGKFKRCFFIAHQPELVDQADSCIVISNGNISIR